MSARVPPYAPAGRRIRPSCRRSPGTGRRPTVGAPAGGPCSPSAGIGSPPIWPSCHRPLAAGQPLDVPDGHDPGRLGQGGVGVDRDGGGAHELLRCHRPRLGEVGQAPALLVEMRFADAELLLGQQVGFGDNADDAPFALQDRHSTDLPLLHGLDDLLEGRVASDGDDRQGHHVAHDVRGLRHFGTSSSRRLGHFTCAVGRVQVEQSHPGGPEPACDHPGDVETQRVIQYGVLLA